MMRQLYSDDAMLAELRRVADGQPLSRPEYQRARPRISAPAITARFGSWSAALALAGVKSPYKVGGLWFPCPICGTAFRSDHSANARRTCSDACGQESKRRKTSKGRAASPSAARGRARRLVDVGACSRCGTEGSDDNPIEVHHRDRDPYNNAPENLAVLCRTCHVATHRADGDGWSAPKPRTANGTFTARGITPPAIPTD